MADIVNTHVISDNGLRYEVLLTNESDGTGESSVRKIDLSDLKYIGTDVAPSALDIEFIDATVSGFNYVTLYWDRSPSNVVIAALPVGHTEIRPNRYITDKLRNQQESTGDILLSTDGAADGDAYSIHIRFRLRK